MQSGLLTMGISASEIAHFDWSAHPLGPIGSWSPSLRIALQSALASGFPTYLAWGADMYSFFNDAYRPLLGRKLPTALGRPFAELWSEAWHVVGPIAARAWQGEAVTLEDLPIAVERHGYPENTFFTFCYSPVRDEHGAVQGILCSVFETTDKIATLARLKDSQARLRLSLEASGNPGTWSVDLESTVTTVDASFARLFQVDTTAAESGILDLQAFTDRIYDEDRPRVLEQIRAGMEDRVPYEAEYRLRQPDGHDVWVLAKGGVVADRDTGGERFAGVAIDITGRKRMEEQLRSLNQTLEQQVESRTRALLEAEAHLRQAQKLEAVGQLTGGIAHDFNNLLQAMSGQLQLMSLKLERGNTADLERHIAAANGAIDRAASLTHRLLAFARRQALRMDHVHLNDLVRSMGELLARITGLRILSGWTLRPSSTRSGWMPIRPKARCSTW